MAQVDTLRGRVPYFHYNYYDSLWCQSQANQGELYYTVPVNMNVSHLGTTRSGGTISPQGCGKCVYELYDTSSEVAIRMDMDSSAYIKGIAIGFCSNTEDVQWFSGQFGGYTAYSHTYSIESVNNTVDYIFNIYDDGMNLLRSDTVASSDLRIDRYMEAGFYPTPNHIETSYGRWYTSGQVGYEAPNHIGLHYIMFDTTLFVPETFYIGITTTTPLNVLLDSSIYLTAMLEMYQIGGHLASFCCFPYESRRYRVSNIVGEEIQNWAEEECHYGVQTCLYPILALPCREVTNLRYEPLGGAGTIAYVQWDGDPFHTHYELSYGPRGTQPGEGTVVQPSTTHWALSPLDRNTHYDVYVRARCDADTILWSPWSDALHIHIASYGIDDVQAPEVMLSPNPTTGMLTVGCEAAIEVVELYDMQGRCALSRECSGTLAVLDLKSLPAGSYVLVAHTAKGHATRTVEKR